VARVETQPDGREHQQPAERYRSRDRNGEAEQPDHDASQRRLLRSETGRFFLQIEWFVVSVNRSDEAGNRLDWGRLWRNRGAEPPVIDLA
jgi:hypothetical protein